MPARATSARMRACWWSPVAIMTASSSSVGEHVLGVLEGGRSSAEELLGVARALLPVHRPDVADAAQVEVRVEGVGGSLEHPAQAVGPVAAADLADLDPVVGAHDPAVGAGGAREHRRAGRRRGGLADEAPAGAAPGPVLVVGAVSVVHRRLLALLGAEARDAVVPGQASAGRRAHSKRPRTARRRSMRGFYRAVRRARPQRGAGSRRERLGG